VPDLNRGQIITYFTGVRAPVYGEDFIIGYGKFTLNIIHAAGIQSPGLTAAPAIAVALRQFSERLLGRDIGPNPEFNPVRKPRADLRGLPFAARAERIKERPDYGEIVCRCEEISKGEIVDALSVSPLVPTLDGVKRRVRAGMGRCQGGFCSPNVLKIIAEVCGIPLEAVTKKGGSSEILTGDTK
jgi:glycerol-3-phosphate dehydrogenase